MITLDLEVETESPEAADAVARSLGPDNEGYVETEVRGSTVVFRASSERAGTLRNTADDLMACLKVVLGTLEAGRPRPRGQ